LKSTEDLDLIKIVFYLVKLGDEKCFTWLEDLERFDFWIEMLLGLFGAKIFNDIDISPKEIKGGE